MFSAEALKNVHKVRLKVLVTGTLVLYYNARLHVANIKKKFMNYGWEELPYPFYSSDLSPPDFDLFPKLKKRCWMPFSSVQELSAAIIRAV